MAKWFRRIAVWALMLMLLCAATTTAFAYTTLKNSTTFTVNGKTIKASDVAHQGTSGCWYYALYMYQKIWGSDKSFSSTFGTSDNILKNLSNAERKVTVDNIKYFIGKAKLGAVIRVCGCTSSCSYWKNDGLQCGHEGHSMILVAKDADSLTVVDNWGSSVRTAKYTWKEFYNGFGAKGYTYFKYIKWPGASQITAYQPYTTLDSTPRIAKSIKEKTGDADDDQCYLKDEPREASNTVDVAAKGTIIYLSGAVKNSAGNTWYKTEDGYFIYSGDLEILEANATIKSEETYNVVGVSKNSDCYLKDKPYEASDHHGKSVAKGKSVTIVAKVTNYHGNTWYKTSDGKYVYSGDVTTYTITPLFDLNATFRNTEKRDSHAAPYVDSADVKSYAKDATVTATQFVVNSHGNIWAKLSDGSYLCFYDFSSGENKLKYVESDNAVKVSDVKKPTGDLDVGASFGLRGVLKAEIPFLSVSAWVMDRSTLKEALPTVTTKPGMTVRSVNLNKEVAGININYKVLFNKLPKGAYDYFVTAQMGFTYNGKTFKFGSENTYISSSFTVGGASEPTTVKVSSITITNPIDFLTYGDVYQFECEVSPSNATNPDVTWSSSNTDILVIGAESGEVLYNTTCGSVTITATANDGSGVSASTEVFVWPALYFDADIPTCKVGEVTTGTLTITSSPAFESVEIDSFDTSIATASVSGISIGVYEARIYGVKAGETFLSIDVTYPGGATFSSGQDFTVAEPTKVQFIAVYNLKSEMTLGEVCDITIDALPADHDCGSWSWDYDGNILTIPDNGVYWDDDGKLHIVFEAIGTGTTTFTITAEDGSGATYSNPVTVVDSASKVQNITMSATSGLTAQPGGTVTVPVSISNPDNVALGLVSLRFALPTGVTVSDAAVCGVAADASVLTEGNPTIIVAADDGIQGSGQVVNVTFSVDATASFPLSISMHPVVCELSSETEVYLDTFTASIAEASSRIPGDVNDDGKVSYADLLRLAKYLANWDGITINDANADCNGDSKVSYADLLRLAKYLANWDIELK